MKLTKSVVDALTCPPGKADKLYLAEDLTGFGCRVMANGKKIFVLQYRVGRRIRRMTLGHLGDITPAQARTLAEKARFDVLSGKDPVLERSKARTEAITFGELIARWEELALQDRREAYRTEAVRVLKVNFKGLLKTPARDIHQADMQAELDAIARQRGASMGRRSRACVSAMYGWAVKRGLVTVNPVTSTTLEGREVSRDRHLTNQEIGEVWRAAGKLGAPFDVFIRLLLLTLQRVRETAGLTWSEISADGLVWTIPAGRTKNGRAHIVHFAPAARALLASLPRRRDSDLVFATARRPLERGAGAPTDPAGNPLPPNPLSGFSGAKTRLDAEIAKARKEAVGEGGTPPPMPPWRLHDFRRTGVTVLSELGTPWEVSDRLLNHVKGAIQGVAAIYQRHEFLKERRDALEMWSRHVLAVAEKRGSAETAVKRVPRPRRAPR